ncbi:MAG: hypothetical protein KBS73_06110, partial [Bacteroidales bacterium]|nr:hypothetical protein [Candidatus Cacconaster equifaecalis]
KGCILLQVRETAGKPAILELKRDGKTLTFRKSDALENVSGQDLESLGISPCEDIFVMVKAQ